MNFQYKQKVKVKSSKTDQKSFYEGQVGFVIAVESKQILGASKELFHTYLVEIDDEFHYRSWIKEANLEKTK